MTSQEINTKLQMLREKWKNEPDNRKIIEMRAKVLKMALEEIDDDFAREVLGLLG
jgi:hypothetical protein